MDLYIFRIINQFAGRWPVLDNLAIFFADKFGYVLVILVFVIFWRKWKIILQAFAASIISRLVITNVIRWILPRTRPFVENGFDKLTTGQVNLLISQNPQESSFPSGHAAFYFAIATVVYLYNRKLGILFFLASFLMGVARVFVGVHWPLDIIGGALVGIISGWIIFKLFNKKWPPSRVGSHQ
jgi:undecaprenyl-diphosphatase